MDFVSDVWETLGALATVIVIDVVLAGDNAIAVGMAAARLPVALRRRVILLGTVIATALRIALALVAVELLAIVGLTLAGGLLLLYVAWKLSRELRHVHRVTAGETVAPRKSFAQALFQILAADLSMSLDNVLAIAGAARDHIMILAAGLLFSVALMAVAASFVARLMARFRWIGWIGLAAVAFVAMRMIYDGSAEVLRRALVS